ncbi:tail fiber protein, partial [Escherichia coli]|nr:tail fiber protein [Escherichia coli]
RWSSTGALNTFDSEFASEISGYPSGAMLISDDGERIFINTTEGNLSDPNSNGTGWKDILSYLGLGEGSALPVGVPVPWPSATPPTGWMKCNGAAFSAEEYPELAKVYPALKLPDLRGEFIRGWDDGRGVDSGRVVLTGQSQSVQQHTHDLSMAYSSDGAYRDRLGDTPDSDMIPIKYMVNATTFNGSGWVYLKANDSTGAETRPRNLAFNYIVRAV